jgi:hypothetical protein
LDDFGEDGANVILEFPEWYTKDMWEVYYLWSQPAWDTDHVWSQPIPYDILDSRKRTLVYIGNGARYELRVTLDSGETIVVDLCEIKEQTAAANRFMPDYYKRGIHDIPTSVYADYESPDQEAIRRMNASGTWGDEITSLFPDMSPEAIETVVAIYLDRHLFPNITGADGARHVEETVEPAFRYMTEKATEYAKKRIEAYY